MGVVAASSGRRVLALVVVLAALAGAACDGGPGEGPIASSSAPAPVELGAALVAAGGYHSCALDEGGAASCWGLGEYGQLGTGGTEGSDVPVAVAMPDGVTFTELAPGNAHTCALAADGAVWCWGVDGDGIHDAQGNDAHGPRLVRFPGDVVATSLDGYYHVCAADTSGGAWCWGRDTEGQLGNGSTIDSVAPVAVRVPDGASFTRVAAGGYHSCALDADGAAWCWGQDLRGQLGDGDGQRDRSVPGAVTMPSGVTFVTITAGFDHTCALDASGGAWCWGDGSSGQLGDGGSADAPVPVAVTMPDGVTFVSIDAGNAHTCAVASDGAVWCWGLGPQGGAATTDVVAAPTRVAIGEGLAAVVVSAGGFHTCALTSDGRAWCWGDGSTGQLGVGAVAGATLPTPVVGWDA